MTLTLVTIVHLFICVFLIAIVLLQQGKGADAGATFGGGGNTMFGASGADTFLTKVTTFVAICFMVTSVVLAVKGQGGGPADGTLLDELPLTATEAEKPELGIVKDEVTAEKLEDAAGTSVEQAAEAVDAAAANTAEAAKAVAEGTLDSLEDAGETLEKAAETVGAEVEEVVNEVSDAPPVEASPDAEPNAATE